MTMPDVTLVSREKPAMTLRWILAVDSAWFAGTCAQDTTDMSLRLAGRVGSTTACPDSARVQLTDGKLAAMTTPVRLDEAGRFDLGGLPDRSVISCGPQASYRIRPTLLDRYQAVELK
jgi:hypothetical protein